MAERRIRQRRPPVRPAGRRKGAWPALLEHPPTYEVLPGELVAPGLPSMAARAFLARTGSRHGGPQANIEAFTETQWVPLRGDLPAYPC